MASQKAVKIEMDFKPTMTRDGIIRKRLWYGPYKIKALNVRYSENLSSYADRSNQSTTRTGNFFSMDPGGTAWSYLAQDLPRDVTILQSNATVVYKDGTEIDVNTGLYNHHLLGTLC